jgi:hypothetical protein
VKRHAADPSSPGSEEGEVLHVAEREPAPEMAFGPLVVQSEKQVPGVLHQRVAQLAFVLTFVLGEEIQVATAVCQQQMHMLRLLVRNEEKRLLMVLHQQAQLLMLLVRDEKK